MSNIFERLGHRSVQISQLAGESHAISRKPELRFPIQRLLPHHDDGYPPGFTSPANFNTSVANIHYIPKDTKSPILGRAPVAAGW